MKIAIGFCNGLGNLIFLSAAVKVLRNWGYKDITLITDAFNDRNYRFAKDLGSKIFDAVETRYDRGKYDKLFLCGWSAPSATKEYQAKYRQDLRTMKWESTGIHEVLVYLNMIGASWRDFDGYILPIANEPILTGTHSQIIALANPSGSGQARKKRWTKFPELSKILTKLGFSVVLIGWKGELDGCVGTDFTGKLTIEQTAKVLSQCDMLIAPSTAATVIADTVKTPVLLLEGPMFTARAHPLISKYRIVRRYISCAPCFQTGLWNLCKDPQCMDMISVQDVLEGMFKLLKGVQNQKVNISYHHKFSPDSRIPHIKRKVAYMISVMDRYYLFEQFLNSFKNSCLLDGTIFFWNDGSADPRIKREINKFRDECKVVDSLKGISVEYYETSLNEEKYQSCNIASTRVGNLLMEKILKTNESEHFDYVAYLDSDTIMKPKWLQKTILMFESESKKHKLYAASALNNRIDYFASKCKDPKTYHTPYGDYRIRGGVCIHYIMKMDFLKYEFGLFNNAARSSDISKSNEMVEKGYRCMILIPSMVQHMGAMASSFRNNIGVIAEDFQ